VKVGADGVGRAIAERFAREGDRVGLIARDETALKDVQRELQASGASAVEWEATDVSNAAAVFAAADQLERRLGYVDIWINDAMETVFSTVADINPVEFRRVTEVTYLGFVYGTMATLKSMRPRRRGRIIQIGSALAYRGIPLQAAYCGAKHAIRGFTNSLRTELLHEKSGIQCVSSSCRQSTRRNSIGRGPTFPTLRGRWVTLSSRRWSQMRCFA
jgi:NAD(P)-dependent dehydrogenase (short-subunit alcohol dehydrogenase family)